MKLVDEQDDLSLRVGDLLEHRLEAFFELPAELGPGDKGAHVECEDDAIAQALGDVAADDTLRKAFDDRGFADSRFADQHGIVLRPARQHLDDPTNLFIAADDRVELALAGRFSQVASVPLKRLILAFGILVGHTLRASDLGEGLQDGVFRNCLLLEELR